MLHLGEIQPLRGALHEYVHRAPDDRERLAPDPERHQDGHDGVGVVPVAKVDDQTADHDPEARGGVSDQVQEGAAQVEVVAVGAEQKGGQSVDHQAGGGESDHPQTLDRLGSSRRRTASTMMYTEMATSTAELNMATRISARL